MNLISIEFYDEYAHRFKELHITKELHEDLKGYEPARRGFFENQKYLGYNFFEAFKKRTGVDLTGYYHNRNGANINVR